jgi:uncharacterized ion transporter superfamily protein YfcC
LALIFFVLCCCYSIFPAAAWGIFRNAHPVNQFAGWGWLAAAAMHYLIMTVAGGLIYHFSGEPAAYALLLPISFLVLLAICFKSLWICITGKVQWRGTQYARDELSAKEADAGPEKTI